MVEAAHGRPPRFPYVKGSPFNAALLFGMHLTVIGRIGDNSRGTDVDEAEHLSRGASQVWTKAFAPSVRSAWDGQGPNALRIAMTDGRLVGALLLGNQRLADPLRALIEGEYELCEFETALAAGGRDLPDVVLRAWQAVGSPAPETRL